jgi:Flp pilus assembly protein TadG
MFGMLGLAFDLGRAFVLKNELQIFADAAALAGTRFLDGTQNGLQQAHTYARQGPLTANPNAIAFDSAPLAVSQVTDTYGQTFNGTYDAYATASAPAANQYRFLRVVASSSMTVMFLGVLPGISGQMPISATSVAGQHAQTASYSDGGLVPLTAAAHDPSVSGPTPFGLTRGVEYTLRWNNPKKGSICTGDLGFDPNMPPSAHAYLDFGQGNGASNLRLAIEYGGCPSARTGCSAGTITAGSVVSQVPGKKEGPVVSAFQNRSLQDPDQTSYTMAAYEASTTRNGRRVVTVPINNPALTDGNGANATYTIIGFANFLLPPADLVSRADICAIYLGPASPNGFTSGGTDGTSTYSIVLFK